MVDTVAGKKWLLSVKKFFLSSKIAFLASFRGPALFLTLVSASSKLIEIYTLSEGRFLTG